MKRYSLILLLLLVAMHSFACLETYQFKIFPVGLSEGKIYTVDVQIRRTNVRKGQWGNTKIEQGSEFDVMWVMWTHLSVYDQNQNLISTAPVDTVIALKWHYADTLQKYYQKGMQMILSKNTQLELFSPDYISFCDFQKECKLLSLVSSKNKAYVSYAGRKFDLPVLKDTAFYGFDALSNSGGDIRSYNVSSVRIYKCKSMQLLLVDIAKGQILSNGDGSVPPCKEFTPDFPYNDLNKATYEEPLMHHGYAFDVFLVI